MSLVEFIEANLASDNPLIQAVSLGIIFIVVYEFYNLFFSAITTFFKKG